MEKSFAHLTQKYAEIDKVLDECDEVLVERNRVRNKDLN